MVYKTLEGKSHVFGYFWNKGSDGTWQEEIYNQELAHAVVEDE